MFIRRKTFLLFLTLTLCFMTLRPSEDEVNYVKKVILIVAYPRSGSSLLGALMSAPKNAAYFYEPLKILEGRPKKLSSGFPMLKRLANCDRNLIRRIGWAQKRLYFQMIYKGARDCDKRDPMIVKTIRLRASNILDDNLEGYKVIHLVRDPRASMASILKEPEFWTKGQMDFRRLCRSIEADLDGFQKCRNCIRIRYEDLIEDVEEETRRLYDFTGLDFEATGVADLAFNLTHTKILNASAVYKAGYFALTRGDDFITDSWRTQLPLRTLRRLEADESCVRVLKRLKYI